MVEGRDIYRPVILSIALFLTACSSNVRDEVLQVERHKEQSIKINKNKPIISPQKKASPKQSSDALSSSSKVKKPPVTIGSKELEKMLKGLNRQSVTNLLGAPNFKRKEDPARIWRYDATSCSLIIIFYKLQKEILVSHVETLLKKTPGHCSIRLQYSSETRKKKVKN